MKPWTVCRVILWTFLTVGAWQETGPFTAISLALTFAAGEIVAWGLGDVMRAEAERKVNEWKRKREARR